MKLRKKRRSMNIRLLSPVFSGKEQVADSVFDTFLSLLLFVGIGGALLNMFSVAAVGILPVICAAVVTAAYFFVVRLEIKKKLIALAILFAADILAWAMAFKFARAGFYSVLNSVSAVIDIERMKIFSLFETGVLPEKEIGCVTLFLTLIAPLFALLCAYLVQNRSKLTVAVLLMLTALLGIMEAADHSGIWAALLCGAVALMIVRSLLDSGSMSSVLAVCSVLLCAFLSAAALLLIFSGSQTSAIGQSLSEKKYRIAQNIHRLRYEKESTVKDDDDVIETLIMPEGDFYSIKNEFSPSYETTLKITMSDCEEAPSVYLRGYVGEVYTESGWRALPKAPLGKYSSLFFTLHKNGFYPQTQLAMVSEILDEELNADSQISVQLSLETACRGFGYAPYELYAADSELLGADSLAQTNINGRGREQYSYKILPNQVKRYSALDKLLTEQMQSPSKRLSEYLALESKYRSFVYASYTDITDEQKNFLSSYIGEPAVAGETHISYDEARKKIFHSLADVLEYEEEVESYKGEQSFLRFVMRELQYGYAPHYATVTVMMLRHLGIPARYVEGYVITPDDADSIEPNESFSITDYSAHAWAEYYHDGLGWLPLDTSPNFANYMEGTGAPPEYAAEAPAEGEQEQQEEIPPVYNKNHKDDEEPPISELSKIAAPWIIFVIILLLLIFGWWYRRMTIIKNRRATLENEDNNAAVCAVMQYMLRLLEVCSIKSHQNTHAAVVEAVGESWGSEWQTDFGKMMSIFQKAAYSRHTVSNQEREFAEESLEAMLQKVDSLQSRRSRIKLKYFKCLY